MRAIIINLLTIIKVKVSKLLYFIINNSMLKVKGNKMIKLSEGQILNLFEGNTGLDLEEEFAVCKALAMLPVLMAQDAIKNIEFISARDTLAFFIETLPPKKSMIVLSDAFTDLDEEKQIRVVLHELGHYFNKLDYTEEIAEEFTRKYYAS